VGAVSTATGVETHESSAEPQQQPAKAQVQDGVRRKTCTACGRQEVKASFSKNQWVKVRLCRESMSKHAH
jgi:hypothetical protein